MTDSHHHPVQCLDFRTTKCPLNFVKTRLALEKLPMGSVMEVWISAESDSVMNIPRSITAEGHTVLEQLPLAGNPPGWKLFIRRGR